MLSLHLLFDVVYNIIKASFSFSVLAFLET